MSLTEVKISGESTQLLPKHENRRTSYIEKLADFVSWLGTNYLTAISILSAVIVIVVLIEVMPPPSTIEIQNQNSLLKQSNIKESVENNLVVETKLGKVEGRTLVSRDGRNYYAFLGIPYAQAPVGRLRFKNTKPAKKWDGILSNSQGPPPCKQLEDLKTGLPLGSEDCLFVNLHTPMIPTKDGINETLLPVMVYIFGGAFFSGDCNKYSPEYLMDEDVIWVSLQHRLGPFGFLNTEDGEIPGNLGFKDQVMALKWVKENIQAFGGDPNKVTLFGSSSGSISVSNHMISPMSEGLFQRAISFSGVSIIPTILVKNPLRVVQYIGDQVNCSTKSTKRLVRCLRDVDADALVALNPVEAFPTAFGTTVEYIEDPNDLSEIFMPDIPYNRYKTGNVIKVPYLLGNTESEQLKSSLDVLKSPELVVMLNENWTQIAPSQFHWSSSAINPDIISTKIWDFYFDKNGIGNDTWRNLTDLISDHSYIHPTFIAASWHAIHSPEDVYLYYFTKQPPKSYSDSKKEGFPKRDNYGPSHGDELQFLYHYVDDRFPLIPKESENYNFSKRFIKMLVNFAETGNVSAPGVDTWDPINPEDNHIKWLRIDDDLEITDIILPRMKFWNQFSPEDLYYA